jgi:hypothetical protein
VTRPEHAQASKPQDATTERDGLLVKIADQQRHIDLVLKTGREVWRCYQELRKKIDPPPSLPGELK